MKKKLSGGRSSKDFWYRGMRLKLVEEIKSKGITDEKVLEAINTVPRHEFLDSAFEVEAYQDKPFRIGHKQTISQPYTVAFQTQMLEIIPREKVLEVGTGSGYQASILAELGARVFTVERFEILHLRAKERLKRLGYLGVRCYLKDGWKGLPEYAPFDKIIVTAGAIEIPNNLLEQLKIGGIMIIPVGKDVQKMVKIIRLAEDEYKKINLSDFRFVPMLHGLVKEK